MENIAIYINNTAIYWSAIVICLAAAACFAMTLALYLPTGGRAGTVFVMIPIAVILSVLFSRLIHWYCHGEQYSGFINAMVDYSSGGYCLPGVLLGTWLAAVIVGKLGFTDNISRLLDCMAPGSALGIALIRLSALFNNSCRSKIVVETPALQHLPLASPIVDSAGNVDYRFATFFTQFLIMLVITGMLLNFFFKYRRRHIKNNYSRDGHVYLTFLLYYSAVELIMDSTRYDSSFMHFNGFVSLVQIVSAVTILGILIYYSILSVKANGRRAYHWVMWVGYFLTLAGVGATEYLVQRYGGWYRPCYLGMSFACFMMAFVVHRMYLTCCEKKKS